MQKLVRWTRTYWIALVTGLMLILALAAGRVAAAPLYQEGTVPPPTPLPTATGVPQATATPEETGGGGGNQGSNDDDDDDDENNQPAPTATPIPASGGAASTNQGQQGESEVIGVVLPDRLNVRAGPGTNFGIVGKALVGETVGVLERNADNSWWRICCATGTTDTGWVSAQFIQLNFDPAQAAAVIPVAESVAAPAAAVASPATTEAVTATTAAAAAESVTATVSASASPTTTAELAVGEPSTGTSELWLDIEQDPPFAWQGQEVDLVFTVTNDADATAREAELRSELPAELRFIAAEAPTGATLAEEELTGGSVAFIVTWPTLAPGASETVTVRVQIDEDAPDGTVIDNLAVVSAAGIEPYTTGIAIGLPPTQLPDFQ